MSKVRINDLAREMEVKSRQILDVLAELGLAAGKTHSSSLEDDEAEKVRAQFERGTRSGGHGSGACFSRPPGHCTQDRSLPRLQARRRDEGHSGQKAGRGSRGPSQPCTGADQLPAAPPKAPAAPARTVAVAAPPPLRRRVLSRARLFRRPGLRRPSCAPPHATPAIASRPPAGPVVAKAPAGSAFPRVPRSPLCRRRSPSSSSRRSRLQPAKRKPHPGSRQPPAGKPSGSCCRQRLSLSRPLQLPVAAAPQLARR